MKKFWIFAASLVVLLALNIAWPNQAKAAPNFLFLLMVFYALHKERADFLWVAFFSGLLLDIFGGGFFGAYTISFLLTAMVLNFTTKNYFTSDTSIEFTIATVVGSYLLMAVLLFLINYAAFNFGLSSYPLSPRIFEEKVWLDIILNLVFAAPIYLLSEFNDRMLLKGIIR